MKRFHWLTVAAIFIAHSGYGQVNQAIGYYQDALLFSETNQPGFGSTARISALGGAQNALGADMSTVGSNPAGLGFFNRSVFSFTPRLNFHDTESEFFDNRSSSFVNSFRFGNVGLVINNSTGDILKSKYKGGSFAISFSSINNFKQRFEYRGRNEYTSILDHFSGGLFDAAFNAFLIDEVSQYVYYDDDRIITADASGANLSTYSFIEGLPEQSEVVERSGGQSQISLAWGGNYNDQFYFGAGLNIYSVNRSEERTLTEQNFYVADEDFFDPAIDHFTIRTEVDESGNGINLGLGAIVRPFPSLTLGLSYSSPTYYSLTKENTDLVNAVFNDYTYEYIDEDQDTTYFDLDETEGNQTFVDDFNLKTPGKLSLGGAYFLGKHGFVTADVDFIDYGSARLRTSSTEYNMDADNQAIRDLYRSVINYRMGAEFRLDEMRFRLGYAFTDDPYQDDGLDRTRNSFSVGAGYRTSDFFVDLAFVNSRFNEYYVPYGVAEGTVPPQVTISNSVNSAVVTCGFNF